MAFLILAGDIVYEMLFNLSIGYSVIQISLFYSKEMLSEAQFRQVSMKRHEKYGKNFNIEQVFKARQPRMMYLSFKIEYIWGKTMLLKRVNVFHPSF